MIKKLILLIACSVLLSACAQQPKSIYSWGDYVKTSTNYATKGQEKKYAEKHFQELKKIIDESDMKKKRVAPGLYAEYGQLLFEDGKPEEAKKYFQLEESTYPESKIFIENVLTKLYPEEAK